MTALAALLVLPGMEGGAVEITDRWGRNPRTNAIVLVDWEGQMANPALRFYVKAPAEGSYPVIVDLRVNHPRLYFDMPVVTSLHGMFKRLRFNSPEDVFSFRISIFGDRDGPAEEHALEVLSQKAGGVSESFAIPIRVMDQDQERALEFNLIVDSSRDATGFFSDPAKLRIAEQAAADWAYFIADMKFDVVPKGAETSYIWARDGSNSGTWITNAQAYRGFLLYIYGTEGPSLTSGGQGSWDGGWQTIGGRSANLRRSGSYQAHVLGNYNRLGWFLTTSDDDWRVTGNYREQVNDLLSVAHHEIGHALFFDGSHPIFAQYKARGGIDEAEVMSYYGGPVSIDGSNHFASHVDPESGVGAFGNEFNGEMPIGRWQITKLDLLCARAGGYQLRPTSAFEPVRIAGTNVFEAEAGREFRDGLKATGGIPFYHWEAAGNIPEGLGLDSFTGEISGTPARAGVYEFMVRVHDYDERGIGATNTVTVNVKEAALRLEIVRGAVEGEVTLRASGLDGESLRVEESGDLREWRAIGTGLSSPLEMPVSAAGERRFYRALRSTETIGTPGS